MCVCVCMCVCVGVWGCVCVCVWAVGGWSGVYFLAVQRHYLSGSVCIQFYFKTPMKKSFQYLLTSLNFMHDIVN